MTEQVRLGNVAERFVQARNVGARLRLRARPLHGEVQKARRALVAGNPVDRIAVDPGLQIREVGSVAAEFARRSAERVQCREPRVLRFEREVERLAEILRQEAERIGALQWRRRIFVLERMLASEIGRDTSELQSLMRTSYA